MTGHLKTGCKETGGTEMGRKATRGRVTGAKDMGMKET